MNSSKFFDVYKRELKAAEELSVREGFLAERFLGSTEGTPWHPRVMTALIRANTPMYGHDLALPKNHMCLDWASAMVAPMRLGFLGRKVHITLGYLSREPRERKFYHSPVADHMAWLRGPVELAKREIHAWLTLDNGVLLDFTVTSSLFKLDSEVPAIGMGVMKGVDDEDCVVYHPQLIVDDRYIPHLWPTAGCLIPAVELLGDAAIFDSVDLDMPKGSTSLFNYIKQPARKTLLEAPWYQP